LSPLRRLCGLQDGRADPGGGHENTNEDVDVAAERELVERATDAQAGEWMIQTVHLRKTYEGAPSAAVHDLSFAVRKGECFGLLGPNGAGKTTTISMLTGLYAPTSGTATICGFDTRTEMSRIYEHMGLCPQHDILWPLLTVVETLLFYCRLKGVPSDQVLRRARAYARSVDLSHVSGRLVAKLSGGMKRRVSLAISLVGEPDVVFLDEPTTGLDPETKRLMWTLIDSAKAERSIVLTTHSMEEADALCGRIGIMAHGKMRCLGTSLHLKSKFGEGYKVEVVCRDGAVEAASAFMGGLLPTGSKVARMGNMFTLQVPTGSLELSRLFEQMDARPDDAGIEEWAVRQTSMEEVFLYVASQTDSDFADVVTTRKETPARVEPSYPQTEPASSAPTSSTTFAA